MMGVGSRRKEKPSLCIVFEVLSVSLMFVLKYYEGGVICNYKHVSVGVTGGVVCMGPGPGWVEGFPGLSRRWEGGGRWADGKGQGQPCL